MPITKAPRKIVWFGLTAVTTASVGILSAIGFLAIMPSLVLALSASAFAIVFEGQVNGEGIGRSLKRLFDPDYLKLAEVENYLDALIEEDSLDEAARLERENNEFYKNYKPKKQYIDYLRQEIEDLRIKRDSLISIYEAKERDEILAKIHAKKAELAQEKEELRELKLFFIKKLYQPAPVASANKLEKAVADLIGDKADSLKQGISIKTNVTRVAWFFSMCAGVCSGLSTVSAISTGAAAFTALSFVPGGIIIALSVMAAIGYTMLMQDITTKVIQKYKKGWIEYAKKREDESNTMHNVRRVLLVAAVGLAFVATYATLGTWFNYVNDGAKILGVVDKVASVLRTIFIVGMIAPCAIYNTENSLESINTISKIDFKKTIKEGMQKIETTFRRENIIRFLNPFRIIDKAIGVIEKSLFLAHAVSIGTSSNQVPNIPPVDATILVGSNELITDSNYRKPSILVTLLFAPFRALRTVSKCLAVGWDYIFSRPRDLKKSFENIFLTRSSAEEPLIKPAAPPKPQVTEDWNKQTLLETCDTQIERISNESWIKRKLMIDEAKTADKITKLQATKEAIVDGSALQRKAPQGYIDNLSDNRNTVWRSRVTTTQAALEGSFKNYANRKGLVAGA